MKRSVFILLALGLFYVTSCDLLGPSAKGKGELSFSLTQNPELFLKEGTFIKSNPSYGDTNSYILTIRSVEGDQLYSGTYGNKPATFVVDAGSYDISLYSRKPNGPMFNSPIWGDSLTVVINSDEQVRVNFRCTQVNTGIRLSFTDEFKKRFPGRGVGILQDNKKVDYTYLESRFAYVMPRFFAVTYTYSDKDTILLHKKFEGGQMITMNLNYNQNPASSSNFTVSVDTARVWVSDKYNVGASVPDGCYTIPQAKEMMGTDELIPIFGYIYGGDPSTTAFRIAPPFTSKSSLVIAPNMMVTNRDDCFVVELPSGKIREGLNLVDKPYILGRAVVVTGKVVEAYYGYPGVKGTKSYMLL